MKRRVWSVLLVVAICLSVLSVNAVAMELPNADVLADVIEAIEVADATEIIDNTPVENINETIEFSVGEEVVEEESERLESVDSLVVEFTTTFQEESTGGELIAYFKSALEERTNGAITVNIHYGGTVATDADALNVVASGAMNMTALGHNPHAAALPLLTGVPDFAPVSAQNALDYFAYLLKENEASSAVLTAEAEANGVKFLGALAGGNNAFLANFDFNNLTELVDTSCVFGTMEMAKFQALGFASVEAVLPWDLYQAFETGLIDATQMASSYMLQDGMAEVTTTWMYDNTYTAGNFMTVNLEWWNSLSEEQREAIQSAVDATALHSAIVYEEILAAEKQALTDMGIKLVEMTDEEFTRWWSVIMESKTENTMSRAAEEGYEAEARAVLHAAAVFTDYEVDGSGVGEGDSIVALTPATEDFEIHVSVSYPEDYEDDAGGFYLVDESYEPYGDRLTDGDVILISAGELPMFRVVEIEGMGIEMTSNGVWRPKRTEDHTYLLISGPGDNEYATLVLRYSSGKESVGPGEDDGEGEGDIIDGEETRPIDPEAGVGDVESTFRWNGKTEVWSVLPTTAAEGLIWITDAMGAVMEAEGWTYVKKDAVGDPTAQVRFFEDAIDSGNVGAIMCAAMDVELLEEVALKAYEAGIAVAYLGANPDYSIAGCVYSAYDITGIYAVQAAEDWVTKRVEEGGNIPANSDGMYEVAIDTFYDIEDGVLRSEAIKDTLNASGVLTCVMETSSYDIDSYSNAYNNAKDCLETNPNCHIYIAYEPAMALGMADAIAEHCEDNGLDLADYCVIPCYGEDMDFLAAYQAACENASASAVKGYSTYGDPALPYGEETANELGAAYDAVAAYAQEASDSPVIIPPFITGAHLADILLSACDTPGYDHAFGTPYYDMVTATNIYGFEKCWKMGDEYPVVGGGSIGDSSEEDVVIERVVITTPDGTKIENKALFLYPATFTDEEILDAMRDGDMSEAEAMAVWNDDGSFTFSDMGTGEYKLVVYTTSDRIPYIQTVNTAERIELDSMIMPKYGDITGDDAVDAQDLVRLMNLIVGKNVEIVELTTDPTGDGECDILDVVRLIRYLAGHDVQLNGYSIRKTK